MGTLKTDSLAHSNQPLYQQLATVFRRKIESGEWAAGMRLPSLDALCAELGCGRVTVRSALAGLEADGLISRARGQGTFVRERKQPGFSHINLVYTWRDLVEFGRHSELEAVTDTSAVPLELPAWCSTEGIVAERYQRMERIYLRQGVRVCFSLVYIASDIYERYADRFQHSAIATAVGETPELAIGQALQKVMISSAGDDTASHLHIPVGSPIAEVIRRVYAPDHRLIYWSRVHFPGQYVHMDFDLLHPRTNDSAPQA
ncbi:GntR family transcriptional regulator [Verticiella sediminum]|uniref:GntR family transcriptional regulator n=1 Tax=Verticiella sediminum TaxID=1247510 RepID=A0A556B0Y7_9BURK|nr:GntR family transcriptional regulator [Verticiella sediminum]TSH98829.1 GntR family transcriptional regulator [Verticiella sediminum]